MTRIQILNLGPLDDHPIAKGKCFNLMGREVVVFRDSQCDIYTIDNESIDFSGSVSTGTVSGGKVWLLYDQSVDLITGQVGDSNYYIRTYRTWVQEGCIMVEYSYQYNYTNYINDQNILLD